MGIRIKFAGFLSLLILAAMAATGFLVLSSIERNQMMNAELLLDQQSRSANILLIQYVSSEEYKNPTAFLNSQGAQFSGDLERITGMPVRFYDTTGQPADGQPEPEITLGNEALANALEGRVAFVTFPDRIQYYAPLEGAQNRMGVVRFTYDRTADNLFYNQIRTQLLVISAGVFAIAALIGMVYFSRVARAIRAVNGSVRDIEQGHYAVSTLKRQDEIGELSRGVAGMGARIELTLAEKDLEQQKLVAAVAELHELDAQQKELLIAVSHELKTPLTAIRSFIDLVEMYPEDPELTKRLLAVTDSETNRLYSMVQKVLRITEADNREFEVNAASISLGAAVENVVETLSAKASARGISIVVSEELRTMDIGVVADPDLLGIVLLNLVDNAIKYNQESGSVHVSAEVRDAVVRLSVRDTGPGIPADHLERVFDAFVTVDKSLSRATGGSGLGLSVARKYTNRMGGHLAISQTGESGSTFTVELPHSVYNSDTSGRIVSKTDC